VEERHREIEPEVRDKMTVDVNPKLKKMFRAAILQEETTAVKVVDGIMRQYVIENLGEEALKEIDKVKV
jgi:hypothetical protein